MAENNVIIMSLAWHLLPYLRIVLKACSPRRLSIWRCFTFNPRDGILVRQHRLIFTSIKGSEWASEHSCSRCDRVSAQQKTPTTSPSPKALRSSIGPLLPMLRYHRTPIAVSGHAGSVSPARGGHGLPCSRSLSHRPLIGLLPFTREGLCVCVCVCVGLSNCRMTRGSSGTEEPWAAMNTSCQLRVAGNCRDSSICELFSQG